MRAAEIGDAKPMGKRAAGFQEKGALLIELVILAVVVAIVVVVMQPWKW